MSERPVIVLGAGATKACGGPLTDEILPAAMNGEMATEGRAAPVEDREELLYLVETFLTECFNVPTRRPVTREDCPSLPMVLSMLRRSVEMGKPLGGRGGEDLLKAKRAIEYAAFAVIEAALRRIPNEKRYHHHLLEPLYARGVEMSVISLNYDVIVDNAMFSLSEAHQSAKPPDYGVEISTQRYAEFCAGGTYGHLHKIHGSLNWLYCQECKRLDLFVSEGMRTGKALDELYHTVPFGDAYSCRGTPCRNDECNGFISPILITPTFVKDYEDNPHVAKIWDAAEQSLQQADRAVIVGYSLPTDDIEVAMLFKRGLNHLSRDRITIVEYVAGDESKPPSDRTPFREHPVAGRYHSLFGPGLDWHTGGFEVWLREQREAGGFPFDG